jgi:hypothetical protein
MATKKLEVDLRPIKDQIKKAQKDLRGLKSQALVGARKKIDLDVKRLDAVIAAVTKICKGRMTVAVLPVDDEE